MMKQLRITCLDAYDEVISDEVAKKLHYTAVNGYIPFSVEEADFTTIRTIVNSVRAAVSDGTDDLGSIRYEIVEHNNFEATRREW